MASVTRRIKTFTQPRGGYIKPSAFTKIRLETPVELNPEENLHPTLIGTAVDYLTRYTMGASLERAFSISLLGALKGLAFGHREAPEVARQLLEKIHGLDDESVRNACKLASFDVWYRNPNAAMHSRGVDEIEPDPATAENLRIMVARSTAFWEQYGPIVKDGFTFETEGYTDVVSSGDGDYLTADTLWDFKVSKNEPTNKHTLQLLMYWIMGQHSGKEEFSTIERLGLYNPRLNAVYLLPTSEIPPETVEEVETRVICY